MHDAGLAPTGHVYFAYDQQTKGTPTPYFAAVKITLHPER